MAPSRGWGGQKYSKCMKMSTRASLWFYCSYSLKWNVGKVYSSEIKNNGGRFTKRLCVSFLICSVQSVPFCRFLIDDRFQAPFPLRCSVRLLYRLFVESPSFRYILKIRIVNEARIPGINLVFSFLEFHYRYQVIFQQLKGLLKVHKNFLFVCHHLY